jgi:hypothetical protein
MLKTRQCAKIPRKTDLLKSHLPRPASVMGLRPGPKMRRAISRPEYAHFQWVALAFFEHDDLCIHPCFRMFKTDTQRTWTSRRPKFPRPGYQPSQNIAKGHYSQFVNHH